MGDSVALSSDGMTLAIGARWNDGNGFVAGHVRVYHKESNGSNWEQLGQDIDGENEQDLAGNSVSLSADGRTLVIGAPGYWQTVDRTGYVQVYALEDKSTKPVWKQIGQTIYGKANQDWCGYGVDVTADGMILAMGCPGYFQNTDRPGYVRVYQRDNGSNWKQLGEDIVGSSNGDRTGTDLSLAADGHTIAIGAYNNNDGGDQAGHVIVLQYDTTSSSWSHHLVNYLTGRPRDSFGTSVALSSDGKTLAAGAVGSWGEAKISGYVKVYHSYDDGMSWTGNYQTIWGETKGDRFGLSLSISDSGNTLAVGGPDNDGKGNLSGHVRVFHKEDPESRWKQLGEDIDGETAGDQSGWAVALSGEDGKTTVAISSFVSSANGEESGQVRVFTLG